MYQQNVMGKSESPQKPLALEILFQQIEDLQDLVNNKEYASFILKESYKTITNAIKKKQSTVQLFNISNLGFIISIKKENYKPCLQSILKCYEEIEDYKTCSQINKLISKL